MPQDSVHPTGASPWGSSPRRLTRASYSNSASGSEPSSPLSTDIQYVRQPAIVGTAAREASTDNEGAYTVNDMQQPEAVKANGNSTTSSVKSTDLTPEGFTGQNTQSSMLSQNHSSANFVAQEQDGLHNKPTPSRYQLGTRPQRQTVQYSLHAKITGLERTGRKDPILRFDVHVCWLYRPFQEQCLYL